MNTDFHYEVIPTRGLTKETLQFYNIKTRVDREGKPFVTDFVYPNGAMKQRPSDKKEFWWVDNGNSAAKAGLFGMDKFQAGSHKYVTITEGEYDAASLYQVLRTPVLSVRSASTARSDAVLALDWLAAFDRIYLAFDADGPGREAAANVAQLFDYNKVYFVKFTKYKDANEYLQNGADTELRNTWWNAKKYQPEGIYSTKADFLEILKEKPRKGVRLYPSEILNDMTYGIRTSESVLVTASEGVGKTELMHHIEYNALKETDYNVGAIFLEEQKARHLQALAGLEMGVPAHLPDAGCSDADIAAALDRVVKKDDRLHLYSHFGSDDPGVILDTIRFMATAGACKLILLDHISMVVSGLAGEDERKALDYLSSRLEMMVKELDFALIMVSHVNDSGQTRGSRYISKVADIRIDISRDLTSHDPVIRNTTNLYVSKNRFCGKTGPAGSLLFDPLTYRYVEPEFISSPSIVPAMTMGEGVIV